MDSETRLKRYEANINQLINESACASAEGDMRLALDLARQSSSKHKAMEKYLEANDLTDLLSTELMFCVFLNLANMYTENEQYQEAL